MSEAQPYQVMPNLDEEEYRALKQDIEENGVQEPVHVDEEGNIIDGYHRVRACQELGLGDPPTIKHDGLTEAEKESLAWRLNMQRRHLEHGQKKELIKRRLDQLIERGEHRTDDKIANELGVSQPRVSQVRKNHVSEYISNGGGQNKSINDLSTVSDFATSEQKRKFIRELLVENPNQTNRDIAEEIGASHSTVGSVRGDLEEVYRPELHNADAHDLLPNLSDESVDLIVTDPPYGTEFDGQRYDTAEADPLEGDADHEVLNGLPHQFYRTLSEPAHCYIFTRWDTYPEFYRRFVEDGPFDAGTVIVWDKREGGHGMGDLEEWAPRHEWILKLNKGRRPLNGDRRPNVIRQQDVRFTDEEKHHPTQKPIALMETLIEASSEEGEVVADFFGGVYPTARAATQLGRRSIAAEIDTDYHAVGREAVADLLDELDDGHTLIYDTEVRP